MKRFTEAGRQAIENKNWYAALTLALMLPEICASLEDPGPGKSAKRYISWSRRWLEPLFTSTIQSETIVFLSAEDCYQARCSVIHSGSAEIEPGKRSGLDRFEFFSSGSHLFLSQGNILNGVPQPNFLQLRVDQFAETVFGATEAWERSVAADPKIQAEKAKLLVIHEPGTTIGGFHFGP